MPNPNPFLRSPLADLADDTNANVALAQQQAPVEPDIPEVQAAPVAPAAKVSTPAAPVRGQGIAPPPELHGVFEASAKAYGVPVNVLMALAQQESGYNPKSLNTASGAKGIMNYMDATSKSLGIDPYDPNQAIPAAAKQLRDQLDQGHSMDDAIKHHFSGPDRALWKDKTEAYGKEVLDKAGQIGQMMYAPASSEDAATTKVLDQNKFSPSTMSKQDYLAEFMAINPAASADDQKMAMDQYDKAAAERTKAGSNRVQDKFKQMQSPDATFNAKLNAKLQAGNNGVAQVLPGNEQPSKLAVPDKDPGVTKTLAGNAIGGYMGTVVGAIGAGYSMIGDDEHAKEYDDGKRQIQGRMNELGGETIPGKAAALVGGVVPALAIPAEMVPQIVGNAGLFAIPAYRDTYDQQIAMGRSKELAMAHAAAAFGINMFAPTVAARGMGAVSSRLGTDAMTGLAGAGTQVGQAAVEGAGFSAANTVIDKGIDTVAGQENNNAWLDPHDMAASALGFSALRAGHRVAAGDPVHNQIAQAINDGARDVQFNDPRQAAAAAMDPAGASAIDPAQTRMTPQEKAIASAQAQVAEIQAAQRGQAAQEVVGEQPHTEQVGEQFTIPGEDGSVHTLTADGHVVETAPAPEPAGPLTASLGEAMAEHAINPQPVIEHPKAPPPPPEPPAIESLPIEALRMRLQEVTASIKENRTAELVTERKKLTSEINARNKEAVEASKPAEEPVTLGPFDGRAEANAMMIRAATEQGVAHEVIEKDGKFTLQPIKEAGNDVSGRSDDVRGSNRSAGEPGPDHGGRPEGDATLSGHGGRDAGRSDKPDELDHAGASRAADEQPALKDHEKNPYQAYSFSTPEAAEAFIVKKSIDRNQFEAAQTGKERWKVQPRADDAAVHAKIEAQFNADMKAAGLEPAAPTEKTVSDSGVKAKPAANAARKPAAKSTSEKTPSWVIREKETGKVVMETYDRKKVDALNREKYEAVPARQHLEELNQRDTKASKAMRGEIASTIAERPLDHGELNIPNRTKNIDRELDKHKAAQAKDAKSNAKIAAEQKRTDKARAKELFSEVGEAIIARHGEKLGAKELRHELDQMVKWEPKKFIRIAEAHKKEISKAEHQQIFKSHIEYPKQLKGAPDYMEPAQNSVVDYMNGAINKADLVKRFADIGMTDAQVRSVTDRISDSEGGWTLGDRFSVQRKQGKFSPDDPSKNDGVKKRKLIVADDVPELNDLTDKRTIEVDGKRRPIRNSNGDLVAPDFASQQEFWRKYDGPTDSKGRPVVEPKPTESNDVSNLSAEGALSRMDAPKRVMVLSELKRLQKLHGDGKLTDEAYRSQVDSLIGKIADRNEARADAATKDRERGADWVEERLMRAKRQGDLDADSVDFALWALRKSPSLASDLAISVRKASDKGTAGSYRAADRLMTLFKEGGNTGTAVHEMLHHTERMMPRTVQDGIAKAWKRDYAEAWDKADPKQRAALENMLVASSGDKAAHKAMIEAFRDGTLKYDEHYQLTNASEFWAVNATRIMSGRYEGVKGGWVAKAKQWLTEMGQYVKHALGLKSDVPILRGLNEVLNGDGKMVSPKMLLEGGAELHDITDPAPPEPRDLTPKEQGPLRKMQAAVQNNMNRVVQVQDRIQELTGTPIKREADYYGAETNRPGRIAARLEDAQDHMLQPLMEKLAKSKYKPEDLQELLHAMHAVERNEAVAKINPKFDPSSPDYEGGFGSGMSPEKSAEIIEKYKNAGDLHEIAQTARDITKATLDLKEVYGLITADQHKTLNDAYENYVPLKGDGEYGPKNKRAMGHEARDEQIMGNIARDYAQAVVVGEKNLARQSLLQMVLRHPDDALWTARVPPKGRYVAGTVFNVARDGRTEASFTNQAQVAAFLEGKGAEAHNYTVKTSAGEQVVEFTKTLQDNEVMVYVKGQPVRLQIHDEKLASQLRPLNQGQMNAFMEGLRGLNRHLSKVYTGYNPSFILRNTARDALTGTINMVGNEGAAIAAKAWTKYPQSALALARWATSKEIPSGKGGQYLKEYRDQGGKVGASWMSDLEQQGKSLTEHFDNARGFAKTALDTGVSKRTAVVGWNKTVGRLAHVVEIANTATENALRLSLFTAMREAGHSPAKAAQAAKTVTVDFDRKGTMTPALGAFYLFMNPAVQGTANLTKTLVKGDHRYQAWAAIGGLAALGYMLAAKGMDDDKDRWLGNAWEKRSKTFMYQAGSHQITIPVSQEYAPFFAFGTAIAEASRGESKIGTSARVLSSFIDAYFPLNGAFNADSDNHPLDLGMSLLPTVLKPYSEIATNRSAFGSKVVPEGDYTKDRPDNLKMNRNTKNSVYDKAAQAIANGGIILGAGKYENDITKVSPEVLKLLWRTYAGGLGTFITDTTGAVGMAKDDWSQMDSEDFPIIKDFYRPIDSKPVQGRYMNLTQEARKAISEFNLAAKAGDGDELSKITDDPAKARFMGMTKLISYVSKASGQLADEAVDVNVDKTLTGAEKRARLKDIDARKEELYRTGISAFK